MLEDCLPADGDSSWRASLPQQGPSSLFVLDAGLYSIFQAVLLANAKPVYRFTPFFGLAAWLIAPQCRKQWKVMSGKLAELS